MASLELCEVTVDYGQRRAVAPTTATVESGEWVGLIGPNGAGKSSLLKAIAGLVDADGSVRVAGDGVEGATVRDRATRIAYVAQDPIVPDDMTTSEYVLLGRTPYIGYFANPSAHDREVVASVLERLRLTPFAERLLGTMSGGERQRAVLARALAQEAPVLLLDEPTSALDIGHQQQALELVAELRAEQRITVVSAMHDLTLAGTYTDRVVLLADGEVVAVGEPADVLTAERLGEVFNVCVTVEIDDEDGAVIVVPRRGFPV